MVARLEANHRRIKSGVYDFKTRPHVVCVSCGCRVNGVQASTPTQKQKRKFKDPFFRLAPGVNHQTGCRYNPDLVVTRLVARSREIKRIDEDAEEIFAAASEGKPAEFRLHIVMEAFKWLRAETKPSASGVNDERPPKKITYRYIRSKRVLKSYLRIAKAVLALIARLQEQKELKQCVQLAFGPERIKWENYFFDLTRYCDLYESLTQQKFHYLNRPLPIALAVEMNPGAEVKQLDNGFFQLHARPNRCPKSGEAVSKIKPVLYFSDESLARSVARASVVLVCAYPKLSEKAWQPASGGLPIFSLSLTIYHAAQTCRFSPV